MKTKLILIGCMYFVNLLLCFGHGDKKHEKKENQNHHDDKEDIRSDTMINQATSAYVNDTVNNSQVPVTSVAKEMTGTASFKDFPSLHPMIVHFPVVLLLLAALTQLAGLFFMKKELSIMTLILLAAGFITVVISAKFLHPHTIKNLPANAAWTLGQHEWYAEFTLWINVVALLLKIISHFVFKLKFITEVLVATTLFIISYLIISTGHYGAQLTHIEGVGPQGKYLEIHNSHSNHH